MTISSTTVKNSYAGNGTLDTFNYTFKIFADTDLQVIIRDATATETVKTLTTHYTVTGAGSASGGTIVFTSGNIPTATETVVIRRAVPQTQAIDYIANDPFPAESHEEGLDRAMMTLQQLQEEVDRSIKLSRTNTMNNTEFTVGSTDRAGKIFGFDDNGELVVSQELGTFKGDWSASTTYNARDIVKDTSTNNIFLCNTGHTSSGVEPLTTNADSAKWDLLVDAASATTSATNAANSASAAATSETNAATSESNAATSESNAATSEANAAASYDDFDDRYLGAKASDPTVDNDGNVLIDGALYFDTTNNVMKVYDLGGTSWRRTTPTTAEQTNINTVSGISSNVTTVANNDTNVTTVATNIASVNTVATNINDVIKVADDLNEAVSEVETVANDLNEAVSEIDTVANNITNVNTVGTNITNVNTVAGISADVTTVANDGTDIGTVATNIANVNTVAGNNANINTVAGNDANITTVAGISSDVTSVANNNADVTTVAGSIANVNNVGGSIANVNTVATNIASVNNFGEVYRISATAPTTSLNSGDLYFDTTTNILNVYGASGWQNAGSSVNGTSQRYNYTATASQTTFTGADNNGNTLAYDAGYIDVYLNGVKLLNGTDVTVSSGTSVVLATGATAGDIVDIVAYGTFSVASLNADNLDSGTVPTARVSGAYTGITQTGTLANSGATVSTFNRTTSDGTILELQKDGTTVSNIGVTSGDRLYVASGSGLDGIGIDGHLMPTTDSGILNDNNMDLGLTNARWKNLYLGGGLYVGGTGTANKLDDYEEGTWSPTIKVAGVARTSLLTYKNKYVKVGSLVTISCTIRAQGGTSTGAVTIGGTLPFTPDNGFAIKPSSRALGFNSNNHLKVNRSDTTIYTRTSYDQDISDTNDEISTTDARSIKVLEFSATYHTA